MDLALLTKQIQPLRAETGVEMLGVFGSSARGDDDIGSDIDLLVRFKSPVGLLQLIGLEQRLQAILGRPVDLGTEAGLHPLIKANVQKDLKIIYEVSKVEFEQSYLLQDGLVRQLEI